MPTANSYSIEVTLARRTDRYITWEWSGKGSGTLCWNAWRRLVKTECTLDTNEPVTSAVLLRNGVTVETWWK